MKAAFIATLILAGAVVTVHYGKSPYNSNDPETRRAVQAFAALKAAWHNNDTNEVMRWCAGSFDPYLTNSFPQMNFIMTHQSDIKRSSLQQVGGEPSLFRLQPNAFRNWYSLITTPQYLLGQVYFYTKENGEWKFTGQTDYHVE
jgi:hypothetical protein